MTMPSPSQKLRIVVGGMVGQFPLGGVAWDYFHYLLGLAELGHEVCYHEDTGVWPGNPEQGGQQDVGAPYTRKFISEFFENYAPHLSRRWHYLLQGDVHQGMTADEFRTFASSADVFLNVSGACGIPDCLPARCLKVFLDTDPGYNHIRLFNDPQGQWAQELKQHDRHFTYAENIYHEDCLLPRLGVDWKITRCISTLAPWNTFRDQPTPPGAAFTTVMSWTWFAHPLIYNGIEYGTKVPEFEKFYSLPHATKVPLKVAAGGRETPLEDLGKRGWNVVDGRAATLTAESYLQLVGQSLGEWSVAKNVYVAMNTGWFSCRTACYLAAGRPAVVQDTKWSRYVPGSGDGLRAFDTQEQAVAALDEMAADLPKHRLAAYELAKQYISPQAVLPPMIDAIFATKQVNATGPGSIPPSTPATAGTESRGHDEA